MHWRRLFFNFLFQIRRKENEWLQEEAQRIRVESVRVMFLKRIFSKQFIWLFSFAFQHEYMSYMEKKIDKRQRTIITLSDYNQQEIKDLQTMKEEMVSAYEEKKTGRQSLENPFSKLT